MTSKFIIRVLMCSTFIAGSGTILQSCIFDPGARTLFASEEPARNATPARKTTPTVRRVAAASNQPAFARSENGSGGNSSSGGGMGGGSSGSSNSDGGGSSPGGWDSDRRLKTDIRRLGTSPAGIPVYAFRYIWGGPLFVGTMAQDLLLIRPDSVIQGETGYYRVDYDKLDIKMISIKDDVSLASAEVAATVVAFAVDAAKEGTLMKVPVSYREVLSSRQYDQRNAVHFHALDAT
ncbi:tail fiber domain-containing protein [Rhizobium leguminosarum]|uniref:tail fiber domain-containing protein n=1 Tax=Rhizobium leguminosarum TaxID=384 RepID=UPI001FE17C8B|nr:tail fiber domain-containing protein [Rhizobium leguminosarum]